MADVAVQGDIFDWAATQGHVPERNLERAFRAFHEAHPTVYQELLTLCLRWVSAGGARWSIKGAFEVLRWEHRLAGLPDPTEEYKLNNDYTSRYSRLLMEREPRLLGLFEQRRLKS